MLEPGPTRGGKGDPVLYLRSYRPMLFLPCIEFPCHTLFRPTVQRHFLHGRAAGIPMSDITIPARMWLPLPACVCDGMPISLSRTFSQSLVYHSLARGISSRMSHDRHKQLHRIPGHHTARLPLLSSLIILLFQPILSNSSFSFSSKTPFSSFLRSRPSLSLPNPTIPT